MKIPFIKCHGSGNDFVMIDETQQTYFHQESQRQEFAKLICEREKSVGADGVLFVSQDDDTYFRMRMFNPDGSESEMCGNGLRCVARLVGERNHQEHFVLKAGLKKFTIQKEKDIFQNLPTYSIHFEEVIFSTSVLSININVEKCIAQKIPDLSSSFLFTALGMPNPHLIAFLTNEKKSSEDIDQLLMQWGMLIKTNKVLFPKGCNVSLCRKISDTSIYVRTFERGVGLTHSCGTAMSASAVAFFLEEEKKRGEWIEVKNQGGMVKCFVEKENKEYSVKLLGNASFDYEGVIDFENHQINNYKITQKNDNEIKNYQDFLSSISL